MRDATTIAAIAAVVLALVALIGLAAPVYSRLGQLEAEIRHSRGRADTRHEETLAEFRRLTDTLGSHYHSPDGDVVFRIPPRASAPQPTPSTTGGNSKSGEVIVPPTEEFGGPQFSAVVITSDLGLGKERLAFGVVSREGPPLQAESATVRTYYLPPNTEAREPRQTLTAKFEAWPFSAGIFSAYPEFDVAGTWELEAELITPDGAEVMAKSAFTVKEVSDTPAVGAPAPASVTSVASDVADITHITTAREPDPALYAVSIDEAIAEGKPLVVCFSTPRYCTTGTCGPQLEQISSLQARYGDRANFIHVEVYKDPHLIEDGGRPGKDDAVDAVREWGLPTEPWTFVVGADGLVKAKFEAFTPASAIERALLETLN